MCFCWPFHDYEVEEAPKPKKEKEEPKTEYYFVQPGDMLYPVNVSPVSIAQ